jgi:hypothetical protein
LNAEEGMHDFIDEDDLQTFDGWLRYQAVDAAASTQEGLDKWRQHFKEVRERMAASPKVGLMKFQRIPGEYRYAVAVQDGHNLWLTLWVKRSHKGEFFVFQPRKEQEWDHRTWDPHTSYHLDGTLHVKSYGKPVIERKNQPLTGVFHGSVDLGTYAGHGPKGVGAICDPNAFSGVAKVAPGILGPGDGVVKVDLTEPCYDEMVCPEIHFVSRHVFCHSVPRVVIRVGSYGRSHH